MRQRCIAALLAFVLAMASVGVSAQGLPSPSAMTDVSDFYKTFSHHNAQLGEVRLHYVSGGKGEPLVLLHGWPATWYEWWRIMPALAERFTVIAPDTRGLGDSSRPPAGYDKRTLAADIAALIKHLGYTQPIHLVGHDLGGQIAYAFANEYPEKVKTLAILDAVIPGLAEWDSQHPWYFGLHQQQDLPEALLAGKERLYLTWFYTALAYDPAAFTQQDSDEFLRTYTQPGALRAGFDYYRAFPEDARQNQEYAQHKLKMPVLWLGGQAGAGGLLYRQLAPVTENLQGEIIQQCGHWLTIECPEQTKQRLLSFFGGR